MATCGSAPAASPRATVQTTWTLRAPAEMWRLPAAVAASSTPTASSRYHVTYQRLAYDHVARACSCLPLPTLPLQPPHSAGHVPGCALLKQLLLTLRPFLGQRQCAGFQPACSALAAAAVRPTRGRSLVLLHAIFRSCGKKDTRCGHRCAEAENAQ